MSNTIHTTALSEAELAAINTELGDKSPAAIVAWALAQLNNSADSAQTAIVSTNFRPYEASILHVCTQAKADMPVVWCDSGFNTRDTYRHADALIASLGLNIHYYCPAKTSAYIEYDIGGIPQPEDEAHAEFTRIVKLEPFKRALAEHNPTVWFTNLRKGQTAFRDSLDVVTQTASGCLKVSPFFFYSDEQLDEYLAAHNLPNEFNYFDPTKVFEKRECGLHTQLG